MLDLTRDGRRRHSLYTMHLVHRIYSEGGRVTGGNAGLTLRAAGAPFGSRTWATYADACRRSESIRRTGWQPATQVPAVLFARDLQRAMAQSITNNEEA